MVGFRPAERKQAKVKLGLSGPSGSGKTLSALLVAGGLVGGNWNKVGVVDTENCSADLYAMTTIGAQKVGAYQVLTLDPPFEAAKYIAAIKLAEQAGIEVLIIDSITHAWAGQGGFLDKQGALADKTGNSFAAWRKVTPEYNTLVDAILQAKMHVIVTMRSKTEYSIEGGRVHKLGMAPVIREGFEYELSVVLDIGMNHQATVSKDRTGILDGKVFVPSIETGKTIKAWLDKV
jgi:hypothetical protein